MYVCFAVFLWGGYGEMNAQEFLVRVVKGTVKMKKGTGWTVMRQGTGITRNTVVHIVKGAEFILLEKTPSEQETEAPKEYTFCEPGTFSVGRLIAKSSTSVRPLSKTLFKYYKKLLASGDTGVGKRGQGEQYTTVVRDADSLLADEDSLSVTVCDSLAVPCDTIAVSCK